MTGRQAWLRDPARPRSFSKVDPRPVEAANLSPIGDDLMAMVRAQIRQQLHERDEGPDEEFLSDEELLAAEQGETLTPYEADGRVVHGLSTVAPKAPVQPQAPGGQAVDNAEGPEDPHPMRRSTDAPEPAEGGSVDGP